MPCGRNMASSWAIRIWCARMIDVTARIEAYTSSGSPGHRSCHSSPARAMGSKSSGSGMVRSVVCLAVRRAWGARRRVSVMSGALDRLDLLDLDDDLDADDRLLRDTVRKFADD